MTGKELKRLSVGVRCWTSDEEVDWFGVLRSPLQNAKTPTETGGCPMSLFPIEPMQDGALTCLPTSRYFDFLTSSASLT
jgi:hypothetical protein